LAVRDALQQTLRAGLQSSRDHAVYPKTAHIARAARLPYAAYWYRTRFLCSAMFRKEYLSCYLAFNELNLALLYSAPFSPAPEMDISNSIEFDSMIRYTEVYDRTLRAAVVPPMRRSSRGMRRRICSLI